MNRYLVTVIILVLLCACKSKKTNDIEQQTETNGFFEAYNKLQLPFTVTDTTLKAVADTDTISYPVFTKFVPDSIFNVPFGKKRKLFIHPVGKIEQKGKESYFVTLVNDKNDTAVYLFVYDKEKFIASMPLVTSNDDRDINSASIDKKLSVVINKEWTVKNNLFYKRTIFAYNNAGVFTTVLTETNEARSLGTAIINPFDTFPARNKYSGDYVKGSKNVLFIRDGKTTGDYLFYVHFQSENKDDPCGGELKGTLKMVSDKAGVFTGNGDPCVLNLTFAGSEVKVKETGSCGNYRGIKCFFNDSYVKKKQPKVSAKKK